MIKLFLKFSYGSVLAAAMSLFTTPIITALIVPEDFGKGALFILAFNLLLQLVLLGIDQGFVRFYYQKKSQDEIALLLSSSVFPGLVSFAILSSILLLFYKSASQLIVGTDSLKIILLLIGTLFVGLIERYAFLIIRMRQQASMFSLLRLTGAIFNFLGLYLYAKFRSPDFYAILVGNLVSLAITTIVILLLTSKVWLKSFASKRLDKELIKYGLPFVPTFMAAWVFEGIDKMMLRRFSTFTELGLFSASFKFVAILTIIQAAFSTFWTPFSMKLYENSSEEALQKFSKVFSIISSVLFIGGLSLILFKDLVMILFSKQYTGVQDIMPFLLFIPIMYTLSEITVGGINYSKKTYWHLVIAVISAATNFLLNRFLVPEYGARGAAISTGVSYIIFFYLRTFFANRYFPVIISYSKLMAAIIIFICVSFANTIYQQYEFVSALIGIFLLVCIYNKELNFAISRYLLTHFRKTKTSKL